MAVCQNLVPLVNIKIAGKWMFIPLKMVLIGIDPYPCYNSQQNSKLWLLALELSEVHFHPSFCSTRASKIWQFEEDPQEVSPPGERCESFCFCYSFFQMCAKNCKDTKKWPVKPSETAVLPVKTCTVAPWHRGTSVCCRSNACKLHGQDLCTPFATASQG